MQNTNIEKLKAKIEQYKKDDNDAIIAFAYIQKKIDKNVIC